MQYRFQQFSPALLLLVIFVPAIVLPAQDEDPKLARFNRLSEQLVCQCGCTMVLAYCSMLNCGSATPMRAIIKDEINKGTSDEEILAKFRRQFGQVVMASPPTTGFDLTAWVMPFLVLGGGLVVAYRFAVKMKRAKAAAPAVPPPSGPSFDSQIEKELEGFEERS